MSKYLEEEEEEEEEEKNGTEATSFCISFSLSLSLFVSRLTHRASISPSRPAKTLVVTVIRVNYPSERERWRETERKNHARAAHEENSYLSREKKKRERERERNARARASARTLPSLPTHLATRSRARVRSLPISNLEREQQQQQQQQQRDDDDDEEDKLLRRYFL